MDIIVPTFENAIGFILDAVMQIYKSLYIVFNSNTLWSLLGTKVEITIPNIFGDDIVGSWSILILMFSYGLTAFIIFSLWKWVRSGIS